MKKITLVTLFIFCFQAGATKPSTVMTNNEGAKILQGEEHFQAYQKFLEALVSDPLNPYIHINLGLAFLRNEEKEKALKEFQAADELAAGEAEAHFIARFNAAILKAAEKDIDGALKLYQAALEVHPESKEVKTNIELLMQQMAGGGQGDKQEQDQQKKDDKKQDGQGDQKKEDQKQGEGDKDKEKEQQPQEKSENQEQKKKQPQPFESKELTQEDVRKILEELKSQEQAIRANEYKKGAKDAPREKDW